MNKDPLEEVKLAWARGETVQFLPNSDFGSSWRDWLPKDKFDTEGTYSWRIKPQPIRVRMYLDSVHDETIVRVRLLIPGESAPTGLHWLGEWQELPA